MESHNTNRMNSLQNRNNASHVFDNSAVNMVKQKLVVVGDIAVGKTTIINALLGQKFKDNYEPSVGVDFFTKNIKFKGKNIKLQIWDSAGQEKYRSLIKNYIRGSSIIFIIYDITNRSTFDNVTKWLKFIRDIENCLLVICGNKLDLNELRKVEFNEGERLGEENNCNFFEVSAKTDDNIQKMLYHSVVGLQIFDQYKNQSTEDLIGELEIENNETKVNGSSLMDSIRNDLNIVGERTKPPKGCNC